MILPSIELLSAILEEHGILWIEIDSNNMLHYNGVHNSKHWNNSINIYELTHMMKEWAYKKGFYLYSSVDATCSTYDEYGNNDNGTTLGDTEFEAVTRDCELILKQQKQH